MKSAVRRRVPPRYWARASTLVRTISRRVFDAVTSVAVRLLQTLPDDAVITIAEKLTLRRPLDYADARILVLVTSQMEREHRIRAREKEPETVEWIQQTLQPGDVLYDVGANVGVYALIAATWTGGQATVYAFEPGSRTFRNLVENIHLNGLERSIVAFQVALGAHTRVAEFQYATVEAGGAKHAGIRNGERLPPAVRRQEVLSYRLDDFAAVFALRTATHLKLDVDGDELQVLSGASKMLASPALRWILVEVDPSSSDPQAVRALLEGSGFRLRRAVPHLGSVQNWIFGRDIDAPPDAR